MTSELDEKKISELVREAITDELKQFGETTPGAIAKWVRNKMWCGHGFGRIDEAPVIEPARHVGRMRCEACGRQTGWVSASALRKAIREQEAA